MKNRTFIMGDIHGMYDKLMACLQAVSFDYTNDKLIQLGDVVDRGPDSYLVVEELLKIKNLVAIRGNHDEAWMNSVMNGSVNNGLLWKHGAIETNKSYIKHNVTPEIHLDFFKSQLPYYIMEIDSKIRFYFVHAGFNRHHFIDAQPDDTVYTWDRDLFYSALGHQYIKSEEFQKFRIKGNPTEVFIGHTSTDELGSSVLMNVFNITNLDTGCGKSGLLTIMNLETREIKQF